jgi:hypothetical protein
VHECGAAVKQTLSCSRCGPITKNTISVKRGPGAITSGRAARRLVKERR